jgi:hypothetical protein
MPPFKTWTATLADHIGLETITDWQGFAWCVSHDGQRAALLYGPPNSVGRYDWDVARSIGMIVDLALPATAYTDICNGPCRQEVFHYLVSRRHSKNGPKSTQLMQPGLAFLDETPD